MSEFMSMYNLKNLIKHKTCFTNPENASFIDLVLTNCPRSFQKSNISETRLSNFHKLTVIVLKQYFAKQKPKVIIYWDYQKFQNNKFRAEHDNEILKCDLNNMEYQHFLNLFTKVFKKHAHLKKTYLEAKSRKIHNKRHAIKQKVPRKNTKTTKFL